MSDDADLTNDNFKKSKDLDKATLELIEFIINSHTKNILDALEKMTRERNELKEQIVKMADKKPSFEFIVDSGILSSAKLDIEHCDKFLNKQLLISSNLSVIGFIKYFYFHPSLNQFQFYMTDKSNINLMETKGNEKIFKVCDASNRLDTHDLIKLYNDL